MKFKERRRDIMALWAVAVPANEASECSGCNIAHLNPTRQGPHVRAPRTVCV